MTDVTGDRRSGSVGAPKRARRRKTGGTAAVNLCVAAALLAVAGCARKASDPTRTPAPVGSSAAHTAGGSASGGPVGSASPPQAEPNPAATAVLPDGRSAAILTEVDLRARTVTFDLVVVLTGGNNATHRIGLADLPAHLKTSGYHEQDGSSAFPYYLTVLHGQVTALEELGVA